MSASPTAPLHAESPHDVRALHSKLAAPGASQAFGCCKHESSSRAAGVALPLPDTLGQDDHGDELEERIDGPL